MATAIGATGKSKASTLDQWEEITIHFDDGSTRILPEVTATLRQIQQIAARPADYETILAVDSNG
jgi:hypothetical protein